MWRGTACSGGYDYRLTRRSVGTGADFYKLAVITAGTGLRGLRTVPARVGRDGQ
jgi:hypothetical protein